MDDRPVVSGWDVVAVQLTMLTKEVGSLKADVAKQIDALSVVQEKQINSLKADMGKRFDEAREWTNAHSDHHSEYEVGTERRLTQLESALATRSVLGGLGIGIAAAIGILAQMLGWKPPAQS